MPGKYTAWGNAYGWPCTSKLALNSAEMAEYLSDMMAEIVWQDLQLAHLMANPASNLSLQSGSQPAHSMQQAAPPAFSVGHAQMNSAPYAVSQQSAGPQMLPAQQVAASTINANQMNFNQAHQAGPTYLVAGNQYLMQQAAPWAPHAAPSAPHAATPAQVGQNMYTARQAAPPAPAPQVYHHHRAPSAVPAHLLSQSQRVAPQEPIDLTRDDDDFAIGAPAPQHAGTKRARSDGTSGAATPRVKKARVEKPKVEKKPRKEKKVKTPKIPNSGLRTPTFAAAAVAPSYDNSLQFQGETLAAQQQQQHELPEAVQTQFSSTAVDPTSDAPEWSPTDSAISGLDDDAQQQQQQHDLSAAIEKQFPSNADDLTFDFQDTQADSAVPNWFDWQEQQRQQQQQELPAGDATELTCNPADTILNLQEDAPVVDDAQQQQQQQELEAAVANQFSSNTDDLTFDVQEVDENEWVPSENVKQAAADFRAGTLLDYEIDMLDVVQPKWRTCI